MSLTDALERMKSNPGLKMTMPQHYRSWQYNYYDKKTDTFRIETGEEWDIGLSMLYNELDGYEDV